MILPTRSDSQVSIRNRRVLKEWADEFHTTPAIVRAAVKRVGTDVTLVRRYVEGEPNRWQTDLFGK